MRWNFSFIGAEPGIILLPVNVLPLGSNRKNLDIYDLQDPRQPNDRRSQELWRNCSSLTVMQ